MSSKPIYIAQQAIEPAPKDCHGELLEWRNDHYYKITNSDKIPAFFMTIVSSGDHWLFIASNGGLTAGRRNAQSALFPYYTHDKIIDSAEHSGSKTIIRLEQSDRRLSWEPFSQHYAGLYRIQRHLYKNKIGNKIVFEEINHDLDLIFRYEYSFSDRFGLVRQAELENISGHKVSIELLDGWQNLLPAEVNPELQATRSNLVDAYKKSELEPDTGLAIYSLSSRIIDKAEPSEALSATTCWSLGLPVKQYLLSSEQLMAYRMGQEVKGEVDCRARKGAYFITAEIELEAREQKCWWLVAEVNQSTARAINLQQQLQHKDQLLADLKADISAGSEALLKKVALADGLQLTEDTLSNSRHFANVLYNIMRGGIFENQYQLSRADLIDYFKAVNRPLYQSQQAFFEELPPNLTYLDLLRKAGDSNDTDLLRIAREYLPLSFSRRHGDPSRPWNNFSIDLNDEAGNATANYEGNWRDIFQNWEALAYSFPAFIEGMISKFVNASTVDGYNPYRISREGIDWETLDPHDPWSYIGYWGDHQIIYLLKLLEHCEQHFPGLLGQLLTRQEFVYANVPYRIRSYSAIANNPSDTIDFEAELARKIEERVEQLGADGKLVFNNQGELLRANLAEKLLVSMLTKLYNLVPGGGIWLNTQRPEWNDANNALVGNGLSVVTLAYLRRFVIFTQKLFARQELSEIELPKALTELIYELSQIFEQTASSMQKAMSQPRLRTIIDKLGRAGEQYRQSAYKGFPEGRHTVAGHQVQKLCTLSLRVIDHSLLQSRREDGLYDAYNLLELKGNGAQISPLYEMLEGQVAVLSSRLLSPYEALKLLDALKDSPMYRADQYSYLLYPNRELTKFLAKNTIPAKLITDLSFIKQLKAQKHRQLIEWDDTGALHFASKLHNVNALKKEIGRLREEGYEITAQHEESLLQAFEEVFNHKAFTGRSGSFFAYEGLGSIYWHMVSKLLLAVAEQLHYAREKQATAEVIGHLMEHYYEIRAGLGLNKSPELYGAFPTDAYSHTPAHAGAQQPGMTGQVKEDILSRWSELGVQIEKGCIHFSNLMLRAEEYLKSPASFRYFNRSGQECRLQLPAGSLAFTYCQLPVIYHRSDREGLQLYYRDGRTTNIAGYTLSRQDSQSIFDRNLLIEKIEVHWPQHP